MTRVYSIAPCFAIVAFLPTSVMVRRYSLPSSPPYTLLVDMSEDPNLQNISAGTLRASLTEGDR